MNTNPRLRPRARRMAPCLKMAVLAFLLVVAPRAINQSTPIASAAAPNALALAMSGKIAFVSNRDGDSEIFVMNADGTNQTQLTHNTEPDEAPVWSPDGSRIAFTSFRDTASGVFVMNPDGSNQKRLTYTTGGVDRSPTWSPDGSRIAFIKIDASNSKVSIYLVGSNGGNITKLTDSQLAWSLAWSPDGGRIAFSCGPSVCAMNADGSQQTVLAQGDFEYSFAEPNWLGTGNKIAFSSFPIFYDDDETTDTPIHTAEISVMNPDGSQRQNLTQNNNVEERTPVWSPDGNQLVFWSYLYPGETSEIFKINKDGSSKSQLTNTPGFQNSHPSWQPIPLACANPVDCSQFFVRQHYFDFLNREPDPAGDVAWQELLNSCSAGDTSCDRINLSSAFFRSPEFQRRGYFLYRFYPTAFGRKPDYDEFKTDLGKVSGFLSDAELESAKQVFVVEFMNRPAFVARFNALGDTQYVDTLLSTAGITHSARDFWIGALGNGTRTRAEVLREIAESSEVYNKYYNQAFVVMQYFGYLHRQPDALYLDWIAHLDATGDYRNMINGFVNSVEYRARFAP